MDGRKDTFKQLLETENGSADGRYRPGPDIDGRYRPGPGHQYDARRWGAIPSISSSPMTASVGYLRPDVRRRRGYERDSSNVVWGMLSVGDEKHTSKTSEVEGVKYCLLRLKPKRL